ncbi:chymotrypsin-like protease CTRL-1 [Chlorella sorokiniana]|uniref:Chymotrypsin-like protease CTRL-1 n=1 Tax=Chlorella sorokiniana TaxID=3076 RepID=A0A2P6TIV4_CHLSO|nr:chymotrypsin-like protease CTRL-1 [Chlorella sorokiniana]|eukprot:PRW39181.1 chymotrypsin-like protease CTRL-1 [Chlorella sorokiniana]
MGGDNTAPGQWPTVARFVATSGLGFCGGTLIAPRIIMASAACFVDATGQFIAGRYNPLVHIGIWDRYISGGSYMEDRRAIRTWVHAGYNATTLQNDIALLLLDRAVSRTPAALPPETRKPNMPYPAGTKVTAVGWGDDGSGTAPAILQQVALQLQSLPACNKAWAGELPSFTTNTMICAGTPPTYLKSSCEGDGGNGLFMLRGGQPVVLGVTSYGVNCQQVKQGAIAGKPGAYTNVAQLVPWIRKSVDCIFSPVSNACRAQVYGDPTVVGFDGSRFTVGGAPGDRVTLLTGSYSACIDAATGVPTTCTVPTITNFWMKGRLIAGPGSQGGWVAPATGGRPLPSTALQSMSLQFGDSLWAYVQQRQLYVFVQNAAVRAGTRVPTWSGTVTFQASRQGQARRVDIRKRGILVTVEQPWIPSTSKTSRGQYATWLDVYVTLTNIPNALGGVLGATYPALLPASAAAPRGGVRASLTGMPS